MAYRLVLALLLATAASPTAAEDGVLREGRSAIRQSWADRVEQSRQESARFIGAAVDAFALRNRSAALPAVRPAPDLPPNYLEDPTLRYGDVVAVEGKLIVFRGTPGGSHQSRDFQELDRTPTLGGFHDRELRAINDAFSLGR